jgi:uncharacterized protein (DUF433 family)
METAVRAPIVLDDQGVAYIEGTTAKVIEIALAKESSGLTPEELQQDLPHLTLAQVYAALAYYHQHKEELDAEIERRYQLAEQLRVEAGESPFARRMRAAGKLR